VVKAALAAAWLASCAQTGAILSLDDTGDSGGAGSQDAAPEGPPDSAPAGTVDSGSRGPDSGSPGPPLAIVLVNATAPSHAHDPQIEARLGRLGFTVEERPETTALSPADGASLVVVSSSADSAGLDPTLADQPIPVVMLESFAYGKLGMTGPLQNQDFGVIDDTTLDIVDGTLSGGLPLGSVNVYTQVSALNYAKPAASAIVVARLHGDAGASAANASTFCYPAGATMASRTAPAARAGVFLRTGTSGLATPEGWVLFDAIVRWAAK
jgi:hypothetical protein